MAIKRKTSHKKLYIAIILLVVLIAATAAVVINAMQPTPVNAKVGVHVGDSFTYSILGTSVLTDLNAVESPGFSQYNQTDYFKITITGISNVTSVSFDTVWRFKNGTEIPSQQTIDLSNGLKTDTNGFWAMYAANLKVGDLLRPTGFDGLKVNATDTKHIFGTRESNLWFIENQFFDVNDPTHNTLRDDYTRVYFDKQTGMLEL